MAEQCLSPPTHEFIPTVHSAQPDHSDYETASSISSSSIEPRVILGAQRKFMGLTSNEWKRKLKVKRKFLPAKLTYFTFFSQRSLFSTYYIIFLITAGLDPSQAGLTEGLRMIVLTLSGLFWGFLADRCKKKIWINAIQITLYTLFVFASPWLAFWIQEDPQQHEKHLEDAVRILLNNTHNNASFVEIHQQHLASTLGKEWLKTHYQTASRSLFICMLCLGIGAAMFGGGRQVLIDTKILSMTKLMSKSKSTFGRQRLWGSFAFSITPLLMGLYLENTPECKISPYLPVFVVHLVLNIANFASCVVLFRQKNSSSAVAESSVAQKNNGPSKAAGIGKVMREGLKDHNFIVLFLTVLFAGTGNGLQWYFQFIYMQEMGGSKIFMGLCVFSQCLVECMVFPVASKITQKIGGNGVALNIMLVGYGLSFTSYSLLRSYYPMVFLTSLLGVTYTLYFCAALEELYKISNEGCLTSLHAIYNSIFSGVGNGVAGIVGGAAYKAYGGRSMYLTVGLVFFAVSTLITIFRLFMSKKHSAIEKTENNYCQFHDIYNPSSSNAVVKHATSVEIDDAISLSKEFEAVV